MQQQQRQPAQPGTGAPVYAALDLGTNNCRLLVVRPSERGFDVVDSFSRIVRLGEGLQITGRLSEKAIERTIRALHICAGKIRRRRVTRLRSVATDACRRAANCAGFVERVKRETGVGLEIIGAREEAALAAAGCEPLLDPVRRRALVFDIGGGSTELMWLAVTGEGRARLLASTSLSWGVARMAETFGSDRISDRAYRAMTEAVTPWLRRFDEANGISAAVAAGEVQMLGTSGPVTIVAGLHLGLARYRRDLVDGCTLAFDDLDAVSATLRRLDREARARLPCIGRERADMAVGGCAILEAICRMWPVGSVRVADRGVREGILFRMIANDGGAA
ncbi:MAG: Ppx/GppA family phosphatase [Alphaproteobacteria bacterium]|nr:Ppx/GppA family phosphatase [Alphaproteobacteria bacterium]